MRYLKESDSSETGNRLVAGRDLREMGSCVMSVDLRCGKMENSRDLLHNNVTIVDANEQYIFKTLGGKTLILCIFYIHF